MVYMNSENDPTPIIAQGALEGKILRAPTGDGGFGYDPMFCAHGMTQTYAEIMPEQKHAVSHRAIAFHKLLKDGILTEIGS